MTKVQVSDDETLRALGVPADVVQNLRAGARPPIPSETLTQVLFANRWVCCVCRQPDRPIVVHHIEPWAKTRDHTAPNLAVLCSEHHGEAHVTRSLQMTLTPERLRALKQRWQEEAARMDAEAIQVSTQLQFDAWIYFNHLRLAELAVANGVDFAHLDGRVSAERAGVCDADGHVIKTAAPDSYMYEDSDRTPLYRYVKAMLYALLSNAMVRNISDDLDRGALRSTVVAGDLIYVQGHHMFTDIEPAPAKAQPVRGRRSANKVEVSFDFDRREATSSSAWSLWLRGGQNIGSLVQVKQLQRIDNKLHIIGTVIGMRNALDHLKSRVYEYGLYKSGLIDVFMDDERESEGENFEVE